MDQTDLCQVVPRQVLTRTPHDCLLISGAFIVLECRIGCLWITGVFFSISSAQQDNLICLFNGLKEYPQAGFES